MGRPLRVLPEVEHDYAPRDLDAMRESEQVSVIPFEQAVSFVEREMAELAEANVRRRRGSPLDPPLPLGQMLQVVDSKHDRMKEQLLGLRAAIETLLELNETRRNEVRECFINLDEKAASIERFAENTAAALSGIAKELLATPAPRVDRPAQEGAGT